MYGLREIKGLLLLAIGAACILWAMKDLFVPIFFFIIGLILINYGLQERGMQSMQQHAQSWFIMRNFRQFR